MSTRFAPSPEVAAIKADLDHPVIDSDGHAIEYLPVVAEHVREAGGPQAVEGMQRYVSGARALWGLSSEQLRANGTVRTSWWGLPAATPSIARRRCCRACSTSGWPRSASTSPSSTRRRPPGDGHW